MVSSSEPLEEHRAWVKQTQDRVEAKQSAQSDKSLNDTWARARRHKLIDGVCIHGHKPHHMEGAYAGSIMVCECCGESEGYFFIGNSGPPLGPHDYCAACSGTGQMMVFDHWPSPPPPKTLAERLIEFKSLKKDKI